MIVKFSRKFQKQKVHWIEAQTLYVCRTQNTLNYSITSCINFSLLTHYITLAMHWALFSHVSYLFLCYLNTIENTVIMLIRHDSIVKAAERETTRIERNTVKSTCMHFQMCKFTNYKLFRLRICWFTLVLLTYPLAEISRSGSEQLLTQISCLIGTIER